MQEKVENLKIWQRTCIENKAMGCVCPHAMRAIFTETSVVEKIHVFRN